GEAKPRHRLARPQRTLGRLSQSEPALFSLLLLPALDRLRELLVLLRHLREAVLPELLRPGPVPLRRFLARLLEIVLGRHRLPSRGEVRLRSHEPGITGQILCPISKIVRRYKYHRKRDAHPVFCSDAESYVARAGKERRHARRGGVCGQV